MNAPATHTAPAQAPDVSAELEAAISAVAALQRAYGNDPEAYAIWIMVEALRKRRAPEVAARLDAERLARVKAR